MATLREPFQSGQLMKRQTKQSKWELKHIDIVCRVVVLCMSDVVNTQVIDIYIYIYRR